MSLGRRDVLCPSQTLAKGWEATRKGEKGQLAQWEMELEKLGRDFGWNKKWAQKEEKKKKKGDKEDLCALHNGTGDAELGFVAVCPPPDADSTSSCHSPGLCAKGGTWRKRFHGSFAIGSFPWVFFLFILYKYLFAPYPKPGGPFLHKYSLNNRIQTQVASCPDSQSSPRQIFFQGPVRFKRRGWLFFQPGEFAQGPSRAAAVQGPMRAASFGSHAPEEPAQPPVGKERWQRDVWAQWLREQQNTPAQSRLCWHTGVERGLPTPQG